MAEKGDKGLSIFYLISVQAALAIRGVPFLKYSANTKTVKNERPLQLHFLTNACYFYGNISLKTANKRGKVLGIPSFGIKSSTANNQGCL
jgi:hypothetical protein